MRSPLQSVVFFRTLHGVIAYKRNYLFYTQFSQFLNGEFRFIAFQQLDALNALLFYKVIIRPIRVVSAIIVLIPETIGRDRSRIELLKI